MASVASPPRPVGAASPPVRHGTCRLTLRIGGMEYRLRPLPAPEGFKVVWALKKLDPEGPVLHYTVAQPKGEPAGCTCPDHESRGSIWKHIMAIAALGLIPVPKAARPPKARTRAAHAKNARQAIAEAKALSAEARRHLADINPRLEEGWVPGGMAGTVPAPAPSFAAGFRQAVAAHVGRLNGTAAADPTFPICAGCGAEFEPTASDDYCEACLREGGAL
jgi:hypothetical protein